MTTSRKQQGKARPTSRPAPDLARMAEAVRLFLDAAGLPEGDENLIDTPRRVAQAWGEEFLDGYGKVPAEVLGERYPVTAGTSRELVVVTSLRFTSMCPHHLLPYSGRAHVAYVPGRSVVGFGRLAALIDCFAHRLILQEELAQQVARTLAEELGSPATACVLEAEQACLRLRGDRQRDALTHAQSYTGRFQRDPGLRAELWARIGSR